MGLVDDREREGGDTVHMRVATWNLRFDRPADGEDAWPHRRDSLAAAANEMAADVLVTQEGLERQLAFLADALPAGTRRYGSCRTPGADDEHCQIFTALPVAESGDFWLSEEPARPGSVGWDAELPRVATFVVVAPRPGAKVAVINCHFDHRGAAARANAARLVSARARELSEAHGGCAVVVTGDFNAEKVGEPVFGILCSDPTVAYPLVDAMEVSRERPDLGACRGSTFHAFGGPATGNDRATWSPEARAAIPEGEDPSWKAHIDWILVPPSGVDVVRARVVTDPVAPGGSRYPSDHFAVLADLGFLAPGGAQVVSLPQAEPILMK